MKKSIAIVLLNYVQYDSIKHGIDALIDRGHRVDLIVPKQFSASNSGFSEMFSSISKYLLDLGYRVFSQPASIDYDLLLEPYPVLDLDSKHKIRYRYGVLSAKPSTVYVLEHFLRYDTVFSMSQIEKTYLNVFTNVRLVGNMKYINFKKRPKKGKPSLLYLPTYGAGSSIDDVVKSLNTLRKDYHVAVKIHHGTNFLVEEKERITHLKENVDKLYDSYSNLPELLSTACIVLTDNSAALFEAMYVNIPVAIFSADTNKFKLNNFDTIQHELVDSRIVLHTNNPENLSDILKNSLKKNQIVKQQKWSKNNLYFSTNPVAEFVQVIEDHLFERFDCRYWEFRKILKKEFCDLKQTNERLYDQLLELEFILNNNQKTLEDKLKIEADKNKSLVNELKQYQEGKLYILAKKIYKLKNGG